RRLRPVPGVGAGAVLFVAGPAPAARRRAAAGRAAADLARQHEPRLQAAPNPARPLVLGSLLELGMARPAGAGGTGRPVERADRHGRALPRGAGGLGAEPVAEPYRPDARVLHAALPVQR